VLTNTGQRVVEGFNVGLLLVSVAGLIVSMVMLQSSSFSRSTAHAGMLAWTLSLVDYLRQIVTQSAAITLLVILPNALMVVVWFVLVGRRLYQLGRPETEMLRRQAQSEAIEWVSRRIAVGSMGKSSRPGSSTSVRCFFTS
jgi:hypothetical protein